MAQKIIIDTDPGIDDAMAIHLAFADPRLDIIGLTTVFGNVTTAQATRNALYLADMAGQPVPVAGGGAIPRQRDAAPPADFVHGPEGFGDLPAPTPTSRADARSAAAFLCESCAAAPGQIIICAVGPLTNLAAALDHDPAIARHVGRVVVMGGSAARHGNVTTCAEANIWNDPHAADRVSPPTGMSPWSVSTSPKDAVHTGGFRRDCRGSAAHGGFRAPPVLFRFPRGQARAPDLLHARPSAVIASPIPIYSVLRARQSR